MKATMRNSRHGSAKHNDRDFNLEYERNDGHIDIERQHLNTYWHCYENEQLTFFDAEHRYYEEHYNETVKMINERAKAARHKERMTSIAQLYNNYKTQPEETILQIGNINQTVDLDTFTSCVMDYIAELQKYDEHIHILDWAIHGDEEVPHAHIRKVYDYVDQDGVRRISMNKALELEHFERPDPSAAESLLNSNKISFDTHMRNKWYDICEEHDLVIERTPDFDNFTHKEKTQFLDEQRQAAELELQQTIAETQARQAELEAMQQQMRDLELAYAEKEEQHKKLKKLMQKDVKEYIKQTNRKHVKHQLKDNDIYIQMPKERLNEI